MEFYRSLIPGDTARPSRTMRVRARDCRRRRAGIVTVLAMIDLSSKRDQRAGVSRCYLCSNARGCALISLSLSRASGERARSRFRCRRWGNQARLVILSASGDAETVALA